MHQTKRRCLYMSGVLGTATLALGLSLFPQGCRTTPVSNRAQVMFIPETQEIAMGKESYQQILAEEKRSPRTEWQAMIDRVGRRIAAVANRPDYDWEFTLLESDQMNAFALPGGKVAVYEGIMPVCQTEAGLAVVMSHEVAHALARHGGERMSHQAMVTAGQKALDFVTQNQVDRTRQVFQVAYGAGTKYLGVLPYSRKHETEADEIGLLLMAEAGYDPYEAPRFWERFGQMTGEKPFEFLSTHPSDTRRAADLREMLPVAMEKYDLATEKLAMGEIIPGLDAMNAQPGAEPTFEYTGAPGGSAIRPVAAEQAN